VPILNIYTLLETRMSNALLVVLGMTIFSLHDLSAEGDAAHQIRLATASFIDGQLPNIEGYKDRSPRLLVPIVLPVTINGSEVKVERSIAARPRSETIALAARLGARVATAADTIYMAQGQPHGTMGVQIRLGEPRIVGDSAVIVFALQSRGTTGRMLPGFVNRYVVVLRRTGNEWRVEAFGKANQNIVPAVLTPVRNSSGRGLPPGPLSH